MNLCKNCDKHIAEGFKYCSMNCYYQHKDVTASSEARKDNFIQKLEEWIEEYRILKNYPTQFDQRISELKKVIDLAKVEL